MKIVIGIPTGQRSKQVINVIKAWHSRGIDVAVLTWDSETAIDVNNDAKPEYFIMEQERYSFAINQNLMMKNIPDWDVFICGADDLWPGRQHDLKERIELVAENSGDKLVWVGDGLFNQQPTHPIITRAMYKTEEGYIFNEFYQHNYVDTDLFARMLTKDRVVKCLDIMFDHRHPWSTNLSSKVEEDEIYRIGQGSLPMDSILFHEKWGNQTINVNRAEVLEIE